MELPTRPGLMIAWQAKGTGMCVTEATRELKTLVRLHRQ